ncbi:RagB/SusD family nutrient uptake outer membrane protein [Flavihumibacter fluvii]|uniref:RagB/SusD family nutrient uptake outer membrane protein n=1 Tax=Flavihumibacter fluvii TaxID=2838157 RepID=UPI001BDDDAA3|nr:RagB/SusD family nutrient uptake outer membrane protein [Flavihumibacter fluvii]ULQ51254.1 RagB/SusD family nutrient uptake outer membrane protein [Flavihumibacter fluvii]
MFKSKYRIIGSLFIVLASFSACTKGLDKEPTASTDESKALLTSEDVESALVGAYSRLGDDNVYGGDMFVYSELMGDNDEIYWSGTYQGMTQIFNKNIPVDNDFVQDTWLGSYNAINVANNVLSAIDSVDEAKQDKVKGEARFIRAAVYFDLVRLYGKAWNDGSPTTNLGVPLVLTPTKGVSESLKVSRNTVAEVYTQVISDLSVAEELLPDDNGFFANKSAAGAMLARVYLQKGDYENAAAAANRVIESGTNSLMETYADAFPYNPDNEKEVIPNTDEDIFAMQVNASQGINEFYTFFSQSGRGDIEINASHFADYEPNDDRINGGFYESGGSIYCGKYDMAYGAVHIIRLAEMYLIRAESNFRLNPGSAAAADDINIIRARVGLDPIAAGDLTLDAILVERKHELSFEGHKLHDAKRLEQDILGIPWNSSKLVFPIPDREMKVNSNLVQNDGY